jgi:metacaspase-1
MTREAEYKARAEELIPSIVHMISGCRDEQTSADVSNVANFQLPDPAGRAGGACTSAMLKVLYADHKAPTESLSFQDVLLKMRSILSSSGYQQIPQLTSSRPLDVKSTFRIVPEQFTGARRAVMVGIKYVICCTIVMLICQYLPFLMSAHYVHSFRHSYRSLTKN